MKKYLVFAGETYYPGGGFNDYVGSSNSLQSAIDMGEDDTWSDWWHIVDTESMKMVLDSYTFNKEQ